MPARALLVLLVMLNFGVATWWLLRPGPLPARPWVQPEGVPALQLLGEVQGTSPSPLASEAAVPGDAALADSAGSTEATLETTSATPPAGVTAQAGTSGT